jgi:hypothetical protein
MKHLTLRRKVAKDDEGIGSEALSAARTSLVGSNANGFPFFAVFAALREISS